ncbi:hypothetical protein GCM10010277_19550 [Streptomyces longisporoflavus]|uniref:chaplin n=1 Tax=Streptomyces longisporoflavus TaxID=28044 RepID=UPI00167DBC3F|nr:chaplin [Streptomyces longisporoflavus]GGV34349.1 hypothetical protein GCM10010277_19550 [Streptomyces longisporoflavus]
MRKRAILATAAFAAVTVIGGASTAAAADPDPGANADGTAANSPGVLSGNLLQVPVHVPINVCGDSVNIVGLLNPASNNTCE